MLDQSLLNKKVTADILGVVSVCTVVKIYENRVVVIDSVTKRLCSLPHDSITPVPISHYSDFCKSRNLFPVRFLPSFEDNSRKKREKSLEPKTPVDPKINLSSMSKGDIVNLINRLTAESLG